VHLDGIVIVVLLSWSTDLTADDDEYEAGMEKGDDDESQEGGAGRLDMIEAAAAAAQGGSEEVEVKEECILFVGDLARGIMESELERAFTSYGKVRMRCQQEMLMACAMIHSFFL